MLKYFIRITVGYEEFDEARKQAQLAIENKKIFKPVILVPAF
jgi:hypothetical protein